MEAADLLCTDVDCIRNGDLMAVCDAVCSMECKGSYGTAFFDHLAVVLHNTLSFLGLAFEASSFRNSRSFFT